MKEHEEGERSLEEKRSPPYQDPRIVIGINPTEDGKEEVGLEEYN
jgi:hypothetical protein